MERPSHIAFQTSHFSRRLPLFALAAFLQVGAALLIMTGLGHFKPVVPGILRFIPEIKQPTVDPMPPPPLPPFAEHLPTQIAPAVPPFDTDRGPTITITKGPPTVEPPPRTEPQTTAPPDHGAVGIIATHTIPPYPPIAVRQGLEGKVMLRLTVLETGRVAKAEIVTSSGSEALDEAAQAWIVAHWAYKPAQDHGQPVASQTLASVTFNLKNAR